ncbi:MAG: alpha/beta hydrolase family protein, partial [bacterium]
ILIFAFWVPSFLSARTHSPKVVVNTQFVTLHDESRDRDVPIKLYAPRASSFPGRLPIILFSPEAGSSDGAYDYLGHYWAEHGYLCLFLDHKGSDHSLLKRRRPLASLRAIVESTQKDSNLADRPLDVSFVITSLPLIEKEVSDLRGRLDPTHLGVAGHSFGAYTALAVAGAVTRFSDGTTRSFRDNRVTCFVALSPPGPSRVGFDAESWRPILRPVLMIYGSRDRGLNGEPASWHDEAFQHLPPRHKFEILLAGAHHMDFSGRQLDGSRGSFRFHAYVEQATLAFWDAFLKGNQSLQQKLNAGKFPSARGITATVHMK